MLLHDFYEHILPSSGYYALARTSFPGKDGDTYTRHWWTDSIDGLVRLTEQFAGCTDVYYATGTFRERGSRTQHNAHLRKSFFLDLDAGAKKVAKHGSDKAYDDRDDALAAIVGFAKETGLVPTFIVSSGEGLHVYWQLDAEIDAKQWTVVAKKFHKFGVAKGLKIDAACTKDSARILRPVGTLHPNGNTVEVLKHTGKVWSFENFSDIVGVEQFDLEENRFADDLAINDEVAPDVIGPPKSILKVAKHCAAVLHGIKAQDKIEEPYWRLMIGIAKHTVEGIEAAHAVSCRHPKYDADEVDDKYERWITGPATCDSFDDYNHKACSSCPHKGKIKSPIQLGAMSIDEEQELPEEKQRKLPEQPADTGMPWDGFIPKGFIVKKEHGGHTLYHLTSIEKENEHGDTVSVTIHVPITHEIYWLAHWSDPANPNDIAQVTLFTAHHDGSVTHSVMDQEVLASKSDSAKYLASKGIHLTTDKRAMNSADAYHKALMQRAKLAGRRPRIQEHFGLQFYKDDLVAVQGEYCIMPNGTIIRASVPQHLQAFSQRFRIPVPDSREGHWGPEVWKEHIMPAARKYVDFLRDSFGKKEEVPFQLAIMMGLASPFMVFNQGSFTKGASLNGSSFTVSLYSKDGGKGKSAVMKIVEAAFGPHSQQDKNDQGATLLARTAELSLRGTMPSFMDEMGDVAAASLAGTIRAVANGSGRVRVTQVGGLTQSSPWALMNIIAANTSMREMVAEANNSSDAIQWRMLELDVNHIQGHTSQERSAFESRLSEIHHTAGAMGALLHLMIVRLGPKKMNDLLMANVERARAITKSKQNERFQERAMGAMLTMYDLLDERGMAPFPLEPIIEQYRIAALASEEFVQDRMMTSNGLELLSNMLHDLQQYTTVTASETRLSPRRKSEDSEEEKRSIHALTYDTPLNHNGRVPDKLKVRHVLSSETSYVSVDAMREWCTEKKVRVSEIIGAAKDANVIRHVYASDASRGKNKAAQWASPFNLAKGMRDNSGGQIRCYAFHVGHLCRLLKVDYSAATLSAVSGTGQAAEAAAA